MAVDLDNIKEQFRSIMNTANTTTATYDLSANLTSRVSTIWKTNPEKIQIDGHNLPAVTIYVGQKSIEPTTIARNQLNGKRLGVITFQVVGMFWNPVTTDYRQDSADDDVENLMENIEELLRRNSDLNGSVNWQYPKQVTYHTAPFDEDTHLRVGIMDLDAKVYY